MKKAMLASAAIAALAASAALVGCSGAQHQVVDSSNGCLSCHSEDKPTYEWGTQVPSSAVECALSVTVKTSADRVVVCTPLFTAEDGSSYVPVQQSAVSVRDGQAAVDLEEGLWVLALDEGDSARTALVHATAQGETAEVEL